MIHHGDLFDVLPTLAAESIDACVTDPPYELAFMGKKWDATGIAFRPETWTAVLRVLKPGAHLVAFGGTRMFHRMASGIEDAGFEIRDCLSWLHGQGFPKSLNLPNGQGTALKPAWEPIILARKPTHGTVAANVERHGTAALNIDACRIDSKGETWEREPGTIKANDSIGTFQTGARSVVQNDLGRWPANVLLDECSAAQLDQMTGELGISAGGGMKDLSASGLFLSHTSPNITDHCGFGDSGGASRFYYVAKPSREERDFGTEGLATHQRDESRKDGNPGGDNPRNRGLQRRGNFHPTVKPVELMRWLVKLVTPVGGVVLDPFTGSGTTGMACRYEHRKFIGIEREADYIAIAERRIAAVAPLFGEASA